MSSVCPDWIVGCNLFSTPSMHFNLLTTRRTPTPKGVTLKRQCARLLNTVFATLSTDCGIIISYQVKQ